MSLNIYLLGHSTPIPLLSYRRFGKKVFHYLFEEDFERKFSENSVQTLPSHHLIPTAKGLQDLFQPVVPELKLHNAEQYVPLSCQ